MKYFTTVLLGVCAVVTSHALAQTPTLKIVVIAGEDAVNVIQQKTAVNPIVEVRDRNDLPVSGAVVTFTVGGQNAAFSGGLQTLTVTTNAAGRAAVTGLTPTSPGAVQINVAATHQGQTATATIAQTNVATAAVAAGAVVAAGAAGGGGGGISGVAIGAIAAAAGGGAILGLKAAGGGSDPAGPSPPSQPGPTPPTSTTYTGPVAAQFIFTTTTIPTMGPTTTCMHTRAINGTLTMVLQQLAEGTVTGSANTDGTVTEVDYTVSPVCSPLQSTPFNRAGPVTGTAANLALRNETTVTGTNPDGGTNTITTTLTFAGALSGGVISGTVTYSIVGTGQQGPPFGGQILSNGSVTFPVMLR